MSLELLQMDVQIYTVRYSRVVVRILCTCITNCHKRDMFIYHISYIYIYIINTFHNCKRCVESLDCSGKSTATRDPRHIVIRE